MRNLVANRRGAVSAEFAIVLPLLLLFIFGIIDAGRLMWDFNRAEKATQVGARIASVTNILAPDLATQEYVGVGGLSQGDNIPASLFATVTCTSTGCDGGHTLDSTTFGIILARMQKIDKRIAATDVTVIYRGSGLGYAGDPNGIQTQPIVTVEVSGLTFKPITLLSAATYTMPDFRTSLTGEDLSGVNSN